MLPVIKYIYRCVPYLLHPVGFASSIRVILLFSQLVFVCLISLDSLNICPLSGECLAQDSSWPDLLTQWVKSWFPKSPSQAPRPFTRAGFAPRVAAAAHLPDPACLGRALLFGGFGVAVNVNSALDWKAEGLQHLKFGLPDVVPSYCLLKGKDSWACKQHWSAVCLWSFP